MPVRPAKKGFKDIMLRMHPLHRVLISLGLSVIAFFLVWKSGLDPLVIFIILWDVFALFYIISSWVVFFTRSTSEIREHARQEDGSRFFVFILILISSFASMFTVLLIILSKDAKGVPLIIYLPVSVAGILFSWVMVHTLFSFHYAHLYYGDDKKDPGKHEEGLDFPEDKKPDYLDFAYFSFVIGMTFQVSDVQIKSKLLRRLALVHGLLSFGLNTFVVALTINLIAGLKQAG
jgi:uncharacterized membrane protein